MDKEILRAAAKTIDKGEATAEEPEAQRRQGDVRELVAIGLSNEAANLSPRQAEEAFLEAFPDALDRMAQILSNASGEEIDIGTMLGLVRHQIVLSDEDFNALADRCGIFLAKLHALRRTVSILSVFPYNLSAKFTHPGEQAILAEFQPFDYAAMLKEIVRRAGQALNEAENTTNMMELEDASWPEIKTQILIASLKISQNDPRAVLKELSDRFYLENLNRYVLGAQQLKVVVGRKDMLRIKKLEAMRHASNYSNPELFDNKDFKVFVGIVREHFADTDPEQGELVLRGFIRDLENPNCVFVFLKGGEGMVPPGMGQLIGTCKIELENEAENQWRIGNLYIRQDHRKHKSARMLRSIAAFFAMRADGDMSFRSSLDAIMSWHLERSNCVGIGIEQEGDHAYEGELLMQYRYLRGDEEFQDEREIKVENREELIEQLRRNTENNLVLIKCKFQDEAGTYPCNLAFARLAA